MARSIWSGTISFGLVAVPVQMFSATRSKELRFHFLHKTDGRLNPIGYDKVDKETGESVPDDEIVRGFEIEKGRFVELDDEDLDRLDIELTHTIDICDFVDLEDIDPVYFRKAYYLAPAGDAEKPYALLVAALERTGKVGVAKVVIRNKQHLSCLRTFEKRLLLETMYYADEIVQPDDIGDAPKVRLRAGEIDMATTLVENLSAKFDPKKYDDSYRKELLGLIRKKAKGAPLPEPEQPEAEVIDLMDALRASVDATKKSRSRARKPAQRRSSTRKRASTRKAS